VVTAALKFDRCGEAAEAGTNDHSGGADRPAAAV